MRRRTGFAQPLTGRPLTARPLTAKTLTNWPDRLARLNLVEAIGHDHIPRRNPLLQLDKAFLANTGDDNPLISRHLFPTFKAT